MYFSGGMIPSYLLIKNLGLMDSLLSMILPTGVSFSYMIIIRKNFETIPKELEESASLDGAGHIRILFEIMLPLSLPVLATFALYYSVERWNEWWNGMLYIKSVGKQPLQLVLRNIIMDASSVSDGTATDAIVFGDGVKMASMVLSMIPIMCVYPFLQKYFVSGLTSGAVKG
jgi:ABC-type sugar transport system, permease component